MMSFQRLGNAQIKLSWIHPTVVVEALVLCGNWEMQWSFEARSRRAWCQELEAGMCAQQARDLAGGSRQILTSSGPTHPVKVSRDSPVSLHRYSFVEREGGKQSEAIRTRCLFFCHDIQPGSSVTTCMSPAGVLLRRRIVCDNDLAELHPSPSPLSSL